MKNKSFRVLSTVIVFVYCFVFCMTTHVSAKESLGKQELSVDSLIKRTKEIPKIAFERYPDIAEFVDKVIKYCETEKDIEEIEKYINSLDEYKILNEKYSKANIEEAKKQKILEMMETEEYKKQEKRINDLAKKYYDFYKKNGYYPKDDVSMIKNKSGLEVRSAVQYAEGVLILREAGYVMTETQLAQACAAAGSAALLDGPLPVGDIIALVAIATIFTVYIATQLYNNQTAVTNVISNYFSYQASQCAVQAIQSSNVYRNNKNQYKYFYARLNWTTPGGGIRIINPISFNAAVTTLELRSDSDNVFTTYGYDAELVAQTASFPSGASWHPAHTTYNGNPKPNNLPHYHATLWWIAQKGHSFYIY